ncbi:MAG: Mov34/MPN/PAD-1 family protein [Promethearchaeota archaeon]
MTGKEMEEKERKISNTDKILRKISSIEDNVSNKSTNVENLYEKISTIKEPSITKYKLGIPTFAPVHLTYKAYKRMIGYAIRYANDHLESKEWKEVYGVLIGEIRENSFVIVKDAIPVCVGGRSGVELEPIHYVDLSEIDASIYERSIQDGKTDFIIGWWHTHPGFGFFFSDTDRITQLGYQNSNPFAVGLIFDHCQKQSGSLGVAALRLKNPKRGTLSKHIIVDLSYDMETNIMNQKINKVIEKIQKNMDKVLKELNYIRDVLDKKLLTNLEKKYGFLLLLEKDMTDREREAVEKGGDYVWGLEFRKINYQKPRFRERIEIEVEKSKEIFEEKKIINSQQRIKDMLLKPNKLYYHIIEDFIKRIDVINPYYDYLDADERKIVENFGRRLNNYYEILDHFNKEVASMSKLDTNNI